MFRIHHADVTSRQKVNSRVEAINMFVGKYEFFPAAGTRRDVGMSGNVAGGMPRPTLRSAVADLTCELSH